MSMKLKSLELDNFRNYKTKTTFEFDENINLIIGPNGIGKTNILEAINTLSIGKSSRAIVEGDLINIVSDYARIVGLTYGNDKIESALERKTDSSRIQKIFKINNAKKSSTQFVGYFRSIMFSPEDIRLVAGSPARRRDYLDKLLIQAYSDYRINLSKYNRVLKHRNKLLDSMKGQIIRSIHNAQLDIWDKQLLESGQVIQSLRSKFFDYLATNVEEVSSKLFNHNSKLSFEYKMKKLSKDRLTAMRNIEISSGVTQIGPHRDDFDFIMDIDGRSLKLKEYGSRGQQRTGVLCIKYLELDFIEAETGSRPILLLDDIFSELDLDYRKSILNIIPNQQTFITSAVEDMIPEELIYQGKRFDLG